jgi:hypothetical protein
MAASSSSSSAGSSPADELWRRVGAAVGPPGEMTPLLEKVRDHAWRITDRDVAGLDVDALYEAMLPVAFAAADERRRRAYEAIDAH